MLNDQQKYEILKAGFYRHRDARGRRYWNDDWGPRPPELDERNPPPIDERRFPN